MGEPIQAPSTDTPAERRAYNHGYAAGWLSGGNAERKQIVKRLRARGNRLIAKNLKWDHILQAELDVLIDVVDAIDDGEHWEWEP